MGHVAIMNSRSESMIVKDGGLRETRSCICTFSE
jgi:hypothetical protein